jgi:hypothetical protein
VNSISTRPRRGELSISSNLLARALVGAEGDLVLMVGWPLDVLYLLCDQSDSAFVALCWDNSNSLSILSV